VGASAEKRWNRLVGERRSHGLALANCVEICDTQGGRKWCIIETLQLCLEIDILVTFVKGFCEGIWTEEGASGERMKGRT
jgi:hypothetical protein